MAVLGWLWLASPFVLIALVSHDDRLEGFVASHLPQCRAVGLTGAVMMVLGVALVPAVGGTVLFTLGTPFVGLLAFLLRDDEDDDGDGDPDLPPVNWDDFERSFWAYVRRGRRPRRPRTPSAA